MNIDLTGIVRRRKPDRRRKQLDRRPPHELVGVADLADTASIALLADTNVYIRDAAGGLPAEVEQLLDRAQLFHCSVCLAEIAVGVANADPGHPAWRATLEHYAELMAKVPASRILTTDAHVWSEAGVIAGTLARTQGFEPHQRKASLNDALIFLTAAKAGIPVLTSSRHEFDLIQQLAPEGMFVHYGS